MDGRRPTLLRYLHLYFAWCALARLNLHIAWCALARFTIHLARSALARFNRYLAWCALARFHLHLASLGTRSLASARLVRARSLLHLAWCARAIRLTRVTVRVERGAKQRSRPFVELAAALPPFCRACSLSASTPPPPPLCPSPQASSRSLLI
jgi:hypothetical protein